MSAVVEFHGFKDVRGGFIVKEFAIISSTLNICILFQSPQYEVKSRENTWLTRNYHKIKWGDGCIPFNFKLIRTLLKPFDVVYTKGLEKQQFLTKFHRNVLELDESWKVPLDFNVTCCLPQHSSGIVVKCAFKSASYYWNKMEKCI